MRTTLTIEDGIARALKERAHRSGKPFKQIVNETLRAGLGAAAGRRTRPYRVKPAALGWRTEAYVEVYCEGAAPPRRLAEVVLNHPEITAAMTVTGGADALLHVRAVDVEHFQEVLERIRTEPFIRKTISYMVLSHLLPEAPEAAATVDAPNVR